MSQKKKFDRRQFEIDTRGMTQSQILAYVMMADKEKEEFLKSFRPKAAQESDSSNIIPKNSGSIASPVKIKKQVSVLVQNMRGKPLMPCSPAKARILLEQDKAIVVQRCPFTIRLKYPTGETKQPIYGGLDPGYRNVGFSYRTKKREVLSGEVMLRTDISDKLNEKRMYRRDRRNRNTRYREARFDNRGNKKGKKAGWLAPSIQHKLYTYIRLVEKFDRIMPVTGMTIEVSPFDTQKMQNPEISGVEYQQGTLFEYEVKEYLLEKWGRKCAYCGKDNVPLEKEHIIARARKGTNRISNLTIACHDCNQKKGTMTAAEFGHPEVQEKAKKPLKAAAFMNIVRSRLVYMIKERFPNYEINQTYGYITKYNRIKMGIGKSHANDAFVISGGTEGEGGQIRSKPYQVIQNRRNNRTLQMNRKGFKPSIRKKRYKYSPGDLVMMRSSLQKSDGGWGEKVNKKDRVIYVVKGVFNYGNWIRLNSPVRPTELEDKDSDIDVDIRDVKLLKYGGGLSFQLPKDKSRTRDENGEDKKKGEKIVKTKKVTKKEKKILDMKNQRSIEDAWD